MERRLAFFPIGGCDDGVQLAVAMEAQQLVLYDMCATASFFLDVG